LGVAKDTVGKYERGKIIPGGDVLARLRERFGVDLNWLLTGDGAMRSNQGATPSALDEQMLEAIIAVVEDVLDQAKRRLPAAKKAQLIAALYELHADQEGDARRPAPTTVLRLIRLAG